MRGTGPDIEGLRAFARRPDRVLTDFFAGRERELRFVRGRVADAANGYARNMAAAAAGAPPLPDPAAGMTILVTGAPGAGKTSLIQKLKGEWTGAAPS